MSRNKRRRLLRIARITAIAVLTLAGSLWLATWFVPLPAGLDAPPATLELLDRNGQTLARAGNAAAREAKPLALADMGTWLPMATVALEDHRFASHAGIDFHAIAGAVWRFAKNGRATGGASTISQQLIKQASARKDRGFLAKSYEMLASWRLEREWSKDRILEAYLNRCDYGNRLIGAAAAARAYFGKAPAALTLREAVFLAGLPQAPSRFNPLRHADAAEARYERARARLESLGLVPDGERALMALAPRIDPWRASPAVAPHFVAELRSHAPELCGPVRTTLDAALQERGTRALRQQLESLAGRGASTGAIVIIEHETGAIRAMIGSPDFAAPPAGQINGATEPRHCGSILKPLLYAQAIDGRRLTAATILPDTPGAVRTIFPDYDPMNYTPAHWGPVRVREALASSLNVPAVIALSRAGPRHAYDAMAQWGIRFREPFDACGAGFILGNARVSLLDVTCAFGAFARGGCVALPRFLESDPPRVRRAVSAEAAQIIADILCDDTARSKGFGLGSPLALASRVPVKTGTSSGFRDAWTVGATARHTVGVWLGNHNGQPMDELAAIQGAAPLWRRIVDDLIETDGPIAAPDAPRLVRCDICAATGLRPAAASPAVLSEWFIRGTTPDQEAASQFVQVNGATKLELGPEFAEWCRSPANFLGAVVRERGPLSILSPRPDARYVFDEALSASQQALALRCTNAIAPRWSVDGAFLELRNDTALWPLSRGRHSVRVTDGNVTVESSFTVE